MLDIYRSSKVLNINNVILRYSYGRNIIETEIDIALGIPNIGDLITIAKEEYEVRSRKFNFDDRVLYINIDKIKNIEFEQLTYRT